MWVKVRKLGRGQSDSALTLKKGVGKTREQSRGGIVCGEQVLNRNEICIKIPSGKNIL